MDNTEPKTPPKISICIARCLFPLTCPLLIWNEATAPIASIICDSFWPGGAS